MVNNVSDNIDDVVHDFVSAYEGSIHKNNEFHVGFAIVSENITKYTGISKRSNKKSKKKVKNKKIVLKAKRTPYKKIHTPTKAKKIPKKKKKKKNTYVIGSKKSARKKGNAAHHKKIALEKKHYVETLKYY